MSFIFNTTLDEELDRYANAENAIAANLGSNLNDTKKQYNVATNKNEFFKNNQGGGYVKVFEQELTPLEDAQMYNQSLLDQGITPTAEDFYAAGFDDAIINEGGFINVQPKSGITRPLTEDVQQQAVDLGFDVVSPEKQPLFEDAISEVIKGVVRGGLVRPSQFLKDNFGIYDPVVLQIVNEKGEFDPYIKILSRAEKEEMDRKIAAGELPNAIDFEQVVEISEEAGIGSKLLGSFAQFVGSYASLGKFFRLGRSRITQGFTGGAASDFFAFKGDEGRLSDIIYDLGEAFGVEIPQNVIVDFMKIDPTDPDYVGRFKNALEGGFLGTVIAEPILWGLGKTFRMLKDGDITQRQVLPFVKAARENMRETFTNVVKDVSERLNQPGKMPPLGSNLGNFGDVAKVEAPTANKPGIIAFHGSGTDFNEFKLEKIGTGEGNQAYGYGLYFTDVKDIAEYYRAILDFNNNMKGKRIKYKGEIFEDLGDTAAAEAAPPSYMAITNIADEMNAYLPANPELATATAAKERLLKRIDAEIEKNKNLNAVNNKRERTELRDGQTLEELLIKEAEIRKQALLDINPDDIEIERGKVFEVNLDVNTNDLVDYDKSLNEQSSKIKKALKPFYEKYSVANSADFGTLLESVKSSRSIPDNEFSKQLAAQGIQGVKYKAAGSRGADSDVADVKMNYVIFDDRLIDILKKYGIAAPVAVSSMAVKSTDQKDET